MKTSRELADERERCVDAFAAGMKAKLARPQNVAKGDRPGWLVETSLAQILGRLKGEVRELDEALDAVVLAAQPTEESRKAVASEAFDVANFAMFVADKVGGLVLPETTVVVDASATNGYADRIQMLEERVAFAEVGRDNAIAMRDEAQALKQRAGESAARRIEALIKLAREYGGRYADTCGSRGFAAVDAFEAKLAGILK